MNNLLPRVLLSPGAASLVHSQATASILRLTVIPAFQLPMLQFIRNYHPSALVMFINPYSGLDHRDDERELQRKQLQKGLKLERYDFNTTIMDRARSNLRNSAMERKRRQGSNTGDQKRIMKPSSG